MRLNSNKKKSSDIINENQKSKLQTKTITIKKKRPENIKELDVIAKLAKNENIKIKDSKANLKHEKHVVTLKSITVSFANLFKPSVYNLNY
jgi:hypothetical protein